jgi:magnesium chelatase subunit I
LGQRPRFGLSVEITTPVDIPSRVEIVRRRDAFERDPEGFAAQWAPQDRVIRAAIAAARERLPSIPIPDATLELAAKLCLALGTDGLRGELSLIRAGRALACLEGGDALQVSHLRQIAASALRHRLRRDPLDEAGSTARIEKACAEIFGP